jgi:ATP-dependent helicase/DNAse subunit B
VRARRPDPLAGGLGTVATAALRRALPDEWSPTQLEAWARCPFRLFLGLGAGLADPEAADLDIDGRDEGSLLHAVLERLVSVRAARHDWPPAGTDADRAEARAIASEVLARFERDGRVGDPAVWAARGEAVLARVDRLVAAEAEERGGLEPALVEHRFGGTSGRPPLVLEANGARVLVKGRVDRVDASPDRLLVIDYKNARDAARHEAQLEPGALGVTSFQVPAYLAAAARELPGRARHEATFVLLRRPERLDPVALDPGDLRAGAAEGEAGRPFAEAVVEVVESIRAGAFPIASRDCKGCPFGAVCRFEGAAQLGEGAEDAA